MLTVNGTELQKHQLKGPVGYEVVGRPTIVDGVASGFSWEKYLSIGNFAPTNDWEAVVKIKTGNSLVNPVRYFIGCEGVGNIGIGTTTGNHLKAFFSTNNGSSYNITLTSNASISTQTYYYVRFGFTGYKYYLEQSDNGINYVGRAETQSTGRISSYPINFGRVYSSNNVWNGSIDLNETYIKVNGKLWFWQPRETERIVVNGVEVWTKPV